MSLVYLFACSLIFFHPLLVAQNVSTSNHLQPSKQPSRAFDYDYGHRSGKELQSLPSEEPADYAQSPRQAPNSAPEYDDYNPPSYELSQSAYRRPPPPIPPYELEEPVAEDDYGPPTPPVPRHLERPRHIERHTEVPRYYEEVSQHNTEDPPGYKAEQAFPEATEQTYLDEPTKDPMDNNEMDRRRSTTFTNMDSDDHEQEELETEAEAQAERQLQNLSYNTRLDKETEKLIAEDPDDEPTAKKTRKSTSRPVKEEESDEEEEDHSSEEKKRKIPGGRKTTIKPSTSNTDRFEQQEQLLIELLRKRFLENRKKLQQTRSSRPSTSSAEAQRVELEQKYAALEQKLANLMQMLQIKNGTNSSLEASNNYSFNSNIFRQTPITQSSFNVSPSSNNILDTRVLETDPLFGDLNAIEARIRSLRRLRLQQFLLQQHQRRKLIDATPISHVLNHQPTLRMSRPSYNQFTVLPSALPSVHQTLNGQLVTVRKYPIFKSAMISEPSTIPIYLRPLHRQLQIIGHRKGNQVMRPLNTNLILQRMRLSQMQQDAGVNFKELTEKRGKTTQVRLIPLLPLVGRSSIRYVPLLSDIQPININGLISKRIMRFS